MPQFVLNIFCVVTFGRPHWLLHLGNALLAEKGGDYPGTIRHSVTVLITKVILEILPSKWHQSILQDILVPYSIHYSCMRLWAIGVFCTIVKCPQDLDGNTTSLDSYSLTVLPEALSRQSKDSHSSIDKAELEHRPILTILKSYCSEIQHRFIPAVHIQHTFLS